MNVKAILHEALLNVLSRTTGLVLFSVVFAIVLTLLGGAEIVTVASIAHEELAFRDAGGSTLIYTSTAEISGSACDALKSVAGVVAAGAIREDSNDEIASALPGEAIPTFDVSPTFGKFRALGFPHADSGLLILISDELAKTLRVIAGDRFATSDGYATVGGVYSYPDDGRKQGYGYAIMVPTNVRQPFDACWIEVWPNSSAVDALLATTLLPGASSAQSNGEASPHLEQLNASLGTSFSSNALFNDRTSRFDWMVAMVVGAVLGFVSIWRRRLEFAAARHAGVGRPSQRAQIAAETTIWTAVSVAMTAGILAVTTAVYWPSDFRELFILAAGVVLAGAPLTVVGGVIASLVISERQLFRYFKER